MAIYYKTGFYQEEIIKGKKQIVYDDTLFFAVDRKTNKAMEVYAWPEVDARLTLQHWKTMKKPPAERRHGTGGDVIKKEPEVENMVESGNVQMEGGGGGEVPLKKAPSLLAKWPKNFFQELQLQIGDQLRKAKIVNVADVQGRLVCTVVAEEEDLPGSVYKASWEATGTEAKIVQPAVPERRVQLAALRFGCGVVSCPHSSHGHRTV